LSIKVKTWCSLKHFSLQVNLMLIQAFSILPDLRTGPAQRHDLKEMIVMTPLPMVQGSRLIDRLLNCAATNSTLTPPFARP